MRRGTPSWNMSGSWVLGLLWRTSGRVSPPSYQQSGTTLSELSALLPPCPSAAPGAAGRDPGGPSRVVGVGRIAGEIASVESLAVRDRIASLVGIVASLNVALFVFNLIPLLPLDGGHVAVGLYEGVKRRLYRVLGKKDPGPVNASSLIPVTLVVVVILGGMSLLLMYADIVNPIRLFS